MYHLKRLLNVSSGLKYFEIATVNSYIEFSIILLETKRIGHVIVSRNRIYNKNLVQHLNVIQGFLVGGDGFEPSKSVTTDLQSAPFGHSGILPYI